MLNFTFRHFNNIIPRKYVFFQFLISRALTICSTFSFGLLLCMQAISLIVGSVHYNRWNQSSGTAFSTTLLVYLILSWCFFGVLFIVITICMFFNFNFYVFNELIHLGCIVECCRRRVKKEEEENLFEENRCCCCRKQQRKECCSRCNHCCIGYEVDKSRDRINNSCCCDCCCSCCIDCCIDCCGEVKVDLPPNLTDNDIVVINDHHRVIYAPDPNAPITMSSANSINLSFHEFSGVSSLPVQDNRHFVYVWYFIIIIV